jgi:hypothetical protein
MSERFAAIKESYALAGETKLKYFEPHKQGRQEISATRGRKCCNERSSMRPIFAGVDGHGYDGRLGG